VTPVSGRRSRREIGRWTRATVLGLGWLLAAGCGSAARSPEEVFDDAVSLAPARAFHLALPDGWSEAEVTSTPPEGQYAEVAAEGPRTAGVVPRFEVFIDLGDLRTPPEVAADRMSRAMGAGAAVVARPRPGDVLDGREAASYTLDRQPVGQPVTRTVVVLVRDDYSLYAVTLTAHPSDPSLPRVEREIRASWRWTAGPTGGR
jgi:hypothetical protein